MVNAIQEIEAVEADDLLHDFGGSHGNKGGDFAQYWLIGRLLELEQAGKPDYLFLCEYVQDIAEFDSAVQPTTLRLYQLKKREGTHWQAHELTGQTLKSKVPKLDKPVIKLLRHVRTFKSLKATGAFVSNGKFDVSLASGQSSINDSIVGLHHLDTSQTAAIKDAIAAAEGIEAAAVDLSAVELWNSTLAVDDLGRHVDGIVMEFLAERAPEHVAQAKSFAEALFTRVRALARRTEKCADWSDLVARRGFCRKDLKSAVERLQALPDKATFRKNLYDKLSKDWNFHKAARVLSALTACARDKVLVGTGNRWALNGLDVAQVCAACVASELSDDHTFKALCESLAPACLALGPDEINALAIYEMTEWALSQTPA